jgi:site-specific DNA recombinase
MGGCRAMLRNPAYEGKACYGKTEQSPRQRITRPLRQKNGISNRTNCHRERPRADWIEVSVPALVSKETFALAQEQLTKNKHHSLRRTIEPTLLQGMLVCQQCGYALYRCSTRTSKRELYYYRCLGTEGPAAQGCAAQESFRPVRLFGQIRAGPNRLLAGRWQTDASRN